MAKNATKLSIQPNKMILVLCIQHTMYSPFPFLAVYLNAVKRSSVYVHCFYFYLEYKPGCVFQ